VSKIIYTDVDATVLDFNLHWEPWLREQGYDFPDDHLHRFNRLTLAFGISDEEESDVVHRYFACEHAYSVPAMKGAAEAMRSLHVCGWRFVAITACPNTAGIAQRRRNNLEAVLGVPFEEVIATGFVSKRAVLSSLEPSVWIEDNYDNALAGHELGFDTYLINHAYNADLPDAGMTRVNDWSEIVERLCTDA
jgi:FMN phosphatase YigB (HAD superfamily)